jgi:hypothetical protein
MDSDTAKQVAFWIATVVAIGTTLAPFVTALVGLVSAALPHLPGEYKPSVALLIGVALGALVAYAVPLVLVVGLCGGGVGGLIAAKMYGAAQEGLARRGQRGR